MANLIAQRKTVHAPEPQPAPEAGGEDGGEGGFSIVDALQNADWGQVAFMAFVGAVALFMLINTLKVLTRSKSKTPKSGISDQEMEDIVSRARAEAAAEARRRRR